MNDNELMHFGVLGMKWGVRRYQNKDGTLTAAGRRRQSKNLDKVLSKNSKEVEKYQELSRNTNLYDRSVRSSFFKVSEGMKFAGEKMRNDPGNLLTKKEIQKGIDFIAEKKFNEYTVVYRNDSSFALVDQEK